jgi:hypothetical protein
MTMKKSSKIIIASVVILTISGSVLAFGVKHRLENMSMQEKAVMFNNYISRKLELNSEQEIKLESLTSRFGEIMQQVKQQRKDRSQFIEQIESEGPMDQAALLQIITEKTEMVNQNAPEVVALITQFIDSLDIEQKTELKEMIQERGSYRGFSGRFGHHHDHNQWIDG